MHSGSLAELLYELYLQHRHWEEFNSIGSIFEFGLSRQCKWLMIFLGPDSIDFGRHRQLTFVLVHLKRSVSGTSPAYICFRAKLLKIDVKPFQKFGSYI
jgi:hypothetical protein